MSQTINIPTFRSIMELAIFEKKLQKVKSVSDETAKQLFDAVNRGRKLAQSLGFDDVYDAQFAIDSIDHDISFRECYDRLLTQDDQLSARKEEVTALETKLHDAEAKVKELQTELEARTSYSRCSIFYLLFSFHADFYKQVHFYRIWPTRTIDASEREIRRSEKCERTRGRTL